MKVTVVRGGGIAGMTTRTQLDSDALPQTEARTLSSYVQNAALEEAKTPPSKSGGPDELLYEVSVDDAGAQVTQRFTEANLPDDVRRLVQWIDARPERSHRIER
jgi:Emfourin